MLQHIIWDWNGTLLDDAAACVAALNVLLQRRGLPPVTPADYQRDFAFPVQAYYRRLGFDFSREDWDALAAEYHAAYAVTSARAPLRRGARAVLRVLRQRDCVLSVLSACEINLLRRMMRERGVLEHFDHVYGRTDLYAHSKLELGHGLLAGAGLAPEVTLLVGDTTHDFEVARALGCACLLVPGGHQDLARLRSCGCPIVSDLEEVVAYAGAGYRPR